MNILVLTRRDEEKRRFHVQKSHKQITTMRAAYHMHLRLIISIFLGFSTRRDKKKKDDHIQKSHKQSKKMLHIIYMYI